MKRSPSPSHTKVTTPSHHGGGSETLTIPFTTARGGEGVLKRSPALHSQHTRPTHRLSRRRRRSPLPAVALGDLVLRHDQAAYKGQAEGRLQGRQDPPQDLRARLRRRRQARGLGPRVWLFAPSLGVFVVQAPRRAAACVAQTESVERARPTAVVTPSYPLAWRVGRAAACVSRRAPGILPPLPPRRDERDDSRIHRIFRIAESAESAESVESAAAAARRVSRGARPCRSASSSRSWITSTRRRRRRPARRSRRRRSGT